MMRRWFSCVLVGACTLLMAVGPGSGPSAREFRLATADGSPCLSTPLSGPREAGVVWEHAVVQPNSELREDAGECTVPLVLQPNPDA